MVSPVQSSLRDEGMTAKWNRGLKPTATFGGRSATRPTKLRNCKIYAAGYEQAVNHPGESNGRLTDVGRSPDLENLTAAWPGCFPQPGVTRGMSGQVGIGCESARSSGAHMLLKLCGNCVDCWNLPVENLLELPRMLDFAACCDFGGCAGLL